jgi:cobalamin biosynthesis protein CobD/CbiB
MSGNFDQQLGELLRAGAPPERDPLFRIRLIERRAHQRFRQRRQRLVGAAVAVALLPAIGYAAITASGASLLTGVLALLFGGALVTAVLFSFRGVRDVVRQLRPAQGTSRH